MLFIHLHLNVPKFGQFSVQQIHLFLDSLIIILKQLLFFFSEDIVFIHDLFIKLQILFQLFLKVSHIFVQIILLILQFGKIFLHVLLYLPCFLIAVFILICKWLL